LLILRRFFSRFGGKSAGIKRAVALETRPTTALI
jgi:hypothetical protein